MDLLSYIESLIAIPCVRCLDSDRIDNSGAFAERCRIFALQKNTFYLAHIRCNMFSRVYMNIVTKANRTRESIN